MYVVFLYLYINIVALGTKLCMKKIYLIFSIDFSCKIIIFYCIAIYMEHVYMYMYRSYF